MTADIEDFATHALLAEVSRRVACAAARQCWYCRRNDRAHTCKHAENPRFHGWEVDSPARLYDPGEWRTRAKRTADGCIVTGIGDTRDDADFSCFCQIVTADRPAGMEADSD